MYLFLILLGGAPQALAGKVLSVLPAFAVPVLTTAAKFYYMLISYHLMGYVLVQYHMDIGYTIEQENFKESEAPEGPPRVVTGEEKTLQDVALMLRSGEVEDAITHIQETVAPGAMTSLALSERYMKMLKLKKMGTALVAHLPVHLNLMAGASLKSEVLNLYLSPLARKSDVPLSPDTRFKIAGWLNETGKNQEALTAYQHIIDDDTDPALIPKAHFRMAQIYHDRLMQPDIARGILDEAIGRYPDGAVADQMRAYRRHLG
jgi:tetratricopeptide (TPR) repeat protein